MAPKYVQQNRRRLLFKDIPLTKSKNIHQYGNKTPSKYIQLSLLFLKLTWKQEKKKLIPAPLSQSFYFKEAYSKSKPLVD